MNIEKHIENGYISRIVETEIDRYINFFNNSYMENLEHSKFILNNFPRWSIISGYYAMHDITKLFLVKKFGLKIDSKVHKTTIIIFKELINDKEILKLLKLGYEEFIKMANDLSEAKNERLKSQYYTGSEFMAKEYKIKKFPRNFSLLKSFVARLLSIEHDFKIKANEFLNNIVSPFINKMKRFIE